MALGVFGGQQVGGVVILELHDAPIRVVHEGLPLESIVLEPLLVVLAVADVGELVVEIVGVAGRPGLQGIGGHAVIRESGDLVHPDQPAQTIVVMDHRGTGIRRVGVVVVLVERPGQQGLIHRPPRGAVGVGDGEFPERGIVGGATAMGRGEVEGDEGVAQGELPGPARGFDGLEGQLIVEGARKARVKGIQGLGRFLAGVEPDSTLHRNAGRPAGLSGLLLRY